MSSLTAGSLIYSALRRIGVLRAGQGANVETLSDGLTALNDMVDSWNTERLAIYTEQSAVYNLVPGQQTYTIGPGGNFSAPYVERVSQAGFLSPNGSPNGPLRTPLLLLNRAQWASIPLKAVGSTISQQLYFDSNFPLSSLSLFPFPTAAAQLELYTWQQLTQFADQTTAYNFPPGYALALRLNLAMQLAPEFGGKAINPRELQLVAEQAIDAKAKIKSANMPVMYAAVDPALTRGRARFDWRTGE